MRFPPRRAKQSFLLNPSGVYWSFAIWTMCLGLFLLLSPVDWYGPSWSYFPQLPHNGYGMGACCLGLGALQTVALWRRWSFLVLSILFFLSGFVFWTAGIILGAEGLLGHQGLMETPFMLYVGAHKFSHSVALMTAYQRQQRERKEIAELVELAVADIALPEQHLDPGALSD